MKAEFSYLGLFMRAVGSSQAGGFTGSFVDGGSSVPFEASRRQGREAVPGATML